MSEIKDNQEITFTISELHSFLILDRVPLTVEENQKLKNDDVEMLCKVADRYYYCLKDYVKALAWYQQAAKYDHSYAQLLIGNIYQHGYGVAQDYVKAMYWYLNAARDEDNHLAYYYIGMLYQRGSGVAFDIRAAIEWLSEAANQKEPLSQASLGYIYETFEEVLDLQKSVNWYQRASDNGFYVEEAFERLNEEGYYPTENEIESGAEEEELTDATDTDYSSDEETDDSESSEISNHSQQMRLPLKSPNREEKVKLMEKKIKELDEYFRESLDISEIEKAKSDLLQREVNRVLQDKIDMEIDKDYEIKLLKQALVRANQTIKSKNSSGVD